MVSSVSSIHRISQRLGLFVGEGRLVTQATLCETVGYGGLVNDRLSAWLTMRSLKASESYVSFVSEGSSLCLHLPKLARHSRQKPGAFAYLLN